MQNDPAVELRSSSTAPSLTFGQQQAGRLPALPSTGLISQPGEERNNAFSALCKNVPRCDSTAWEQGLAWTRSLFSSRGALGSLHGKAKLIVGWRGR